MTNLEGLWSGQIMDAMVASTPLAWSILVYLLSIYKVIKEYTSVVDKFLIMATKSYIFMI